LGIGGTINIMTLVGLALAVGISSLRQRSPAKTIHPLSDGTRSLPVPRVRRQPNDGAVRFVAMLCNFSPFHSRLLHEGPRTILFVPLAYLGFRCGIVSLSSTFVPICPWMFALMSTHCEASRTFFDRCGIVLDFRTPCHAAPAADRVSSRRNPFDQVTIILLENGRRPRPRYSVGHRSIPICIAGPGRNALERTDKLPVQSPMPASANWAPTISGDQPGLCRHAPRQLPHQRFISEFGLREAVRVQLKRSGPCRHR